MNYIRFMLVLTSIVDIFWLMFWIPYYNDKEIAKINYGLHMFVILVSILELVLKVMIFVMIFDSRAHNRQMNKYGAEKGRQDMYEGGQNN